jgi:osmoprotectant transport system ATP-binding protein
MIEYRHIHKAYDGKDIIKDLNLTINDGEFVVLIGPSGCGKTTTLKMLNRLIQNESGEILINGQDIKNLSVTKLRTGIGYVIQQIGLFPNMTVEQNISVVPNLLKWEKTKIKDRVKELLAMVDMPYEEHAHKYPNQLSGGQQQRIGVLRALAAKPPILLMDEPFGALDPITRDALQDEIKILQKKLNITIIFVTHDMGEAIKLGDTIVFMDKGKIIQQASPEDMLSNPESTIVRQFLGKHLVNPCTPTLTCADILRPKVFSVNTKRKTLECLELMKNQNIDALVVLDEDRHYLGFVTVGDISEKGIPGHSIKELIRLDRPTFYISDDAKDAVDIILKDNLSFVVVLKEDQTVAGIITKSSVAKSLSQVVWGSPS